MRHLRKYWLAVAVGLVVQVSAFAQTDTTGTSSTATGGATNTAAVAAPTISGLTTTPAASSAGLASSNILGGYYASVYWQGRAGATNTTAPGGFGQTLYTTSGTSNAFSSTGTGTTSRTGTTATRAGNTTGTTGNRAGATGMGGNTGFGGANSANQSGIVIALPRQIAYTATLNFPTPKFTPTQVQADIRGVLDRSTMLTNSRGIEVVADGQVVVLRGNVQTSDEARLAEGMIRLTPGVRDVRNELKFPAPTVTP